MAGPATPLLAAAYFVPIAVATGKVFFRFASKKAAEAFKKRFASAGSVTTRKPPKSATVTTTGSNKGKSIIKDMTKPVTAPSVRARNPNTTTLPKPPKSSGGGKAAGAAAAVAGVAAGSTATGNNADKPKSKTTNRSTSQGGRSRDQVIEQKQEELARKGGASLSRKRKTPTSSTTVSDAQKKTQTSTGKKPQTKPTPPPARPKKNSKPASPDHKTKKNEKLYDTISPVTGKPVKGKVTLKQHLANIDAAKKKGLRIGSESRKTRANRAKARDLIASAAKSSLNRKGKK